MLEGSRATVLIWAIGLVIAAVVAWKALAAGPGAEPPPIRVGGTGAGAGPGAATGSGGGGSSGRSIYVHVAGRVRRPGLLRVPPGSRVAVAVERAGGFARRADVAAVNLAARLEDGQQVVVPAAGEQATTGSAATAVPGGEGVAGGTPINLGTASVEQLDQVDGIGPTLAQRIVAYRDEQGGLASVGELREVEGIGEKRFAALRDALSP